MLTTRQARNAAVRFNVALFAVPVVLIGSAFAHRSPMLGWTGACVAVAMVVITVLTRVGGEPAGLLGGWASEERQSEIQIRAWAHVGQALMVIFIAAWLFPVAQRGPDALDDGMQWIWLLLTGALIGGGTVVYLSRRS